MDKNNYLLTLNDPESNISYDLILQKEDYVRAVNDPIFANEILQNTLNNRSVNDCRSNFEANRETEVEDGTLENIDENIENVSQNSSQTRQASHLWQYYEVLALIHSMAVHYEQLSHPKKRKYVFENISNDLLSQGISVSAQTIQNKWKSLVRSYSNNKDQQNKTGRAATRFQFFDEIDLILGDKPSNKSEHILESSSTDVPADLLQTDTTPTSEPTSQNLMSGSNLDSETPKTTPRRRKGQRCGECLLEKKKKQEEKMKRHKERMEMETQKLEVEREKIAVLKEYLSKK